VCRTGKSRAGGLRSGREAGVTSTTAGLSSTDWRSGSGVCALLDGESFATIQLSIRARMISCFNMRKTSAKDSSVDKPACPAGLTSNGAGFGVVCGQVCRESSWASKLAADFQIL
jgi:hypothetical protein